MVHFIFLLNTNHLKKYRKICFTIFGSLKQEIWFLQKQLKPWFKQRRKRDSQRGPASQRTPPASDPEAEARLDRRRSRRRRRLGASQGHHCAPHCIPHLAVPKTLTLPNSRYLTLANGSTTVVRGRPPASLAGDRAEENVDEKQQDLAKLLGQEWERMVDYRALATTPVAMAELRRGKLTSEKAMRAHRGSAVVANLTTVERRGLRSTGRSCLTGDKEARARELAETTAATWKRRCAREGGNREWTGAVHATGGAVASWRMRGGLTSRANGDVRTPRVQTRGNTGELPLSDGGSIQSPKPTETRFCPTINSLTTRWFC